MIFVVELDVFFRVEEFSGDLRVAKLSPFPFIPNGARLATKPLCNFVNREEHDRRSVWAWVARCDQWNALH